LALDPTAARGREGRGRAAERRPPGDLLERSAPPARTVRPVRGDLRTPRARAAGRLGRARHGPAGGPTRSPAAARLGGLRDARGGQRSSTTAGWRDGGPPPGPHRVPPPALRAGPLAGVGAATAARGGSFVVDYPTAGLCGPRR